MRRAMLALDTRPARGLFSASMMNGVMVQVSMSAYFALDPPCLPVLHGMLAIAHAGWHNRGTRVYGPAATALCTPCA